MVSCADVSQALEQEVNEEMESQKEELGRESTINDEDLQNIELDEESLDFADLTG